MASLPRFIAALRNDDSDQYWRYYQNSKDGEGAVVTYNFMTSPISGSSDGYLKRGFERYTSSDIKATEQALAEYSSIANIIFVRGYSQGEEVMFGQFDIPDAGGYAYYPITNVSDGSQYGTQEVYIHADSSMEQNHYGYLTILHEVGHALGLKHPHEEGVRLSAAEDKWTNTVMSYDSVYTGDFKLGVLDIIAVQSIYGPARKRIGDDTYLLGKDKVIWDGGGTDTISAAKMKERVYLDLNDGTWNFIGSKASSITAAKQIWLGHFTEIENASGGFGNDTIYGNELANTVRGSSGNDKLVGRAGNDSVIGDTGNDILYGNDGRDELYGMDGADVLLGGLNADTFYGGTGTDRFVFRKLAELGTLGLCDRVLDFSKDDLLDFRSFDADPNMVGRQKLEFLGNSPNGLSNQSAGTAYYNKTTDQLVFEVDGNTGGDYILSIKGVDSMKATYFLV